MTSLDDLKKYDGNPPEKPLARKPYMNIMYGKHTKQLKESGTNINDYILGKILNEFKSNPIVITKNRFPYDVAKNVKHLIVWVNPMYNVDEKFIREKLGKDGLQQGSYVLFENEPEHRSIPGVKHFHLFMSDSDVKKLVIEPEF